MMSVTGDSSNEVRSSIFFVGDEPYCLWGVDIQDDARRFLESFDCDYFDYLLEVHGTAEDEDRAAMSLRTAYHHAMETLFSFLGALLQGPHVPHAWIARCTNRELGALIQRISDGDNSLRKAINIEVCTWEELARASLHWYKPGTERQQTSIDLFADLWRKLAVEFVDDKRIDEYNSLKHGFRVAAGGFDLAVGAEHEYGVPPPADEMKSLGGSKYGTRFQRVARASDRPGDRSLMSENISLNWRIEQIAPLLHLISMSIRNVIGALRALNGDDPEKIRFTRPKDDAAFAEPWHPVGGVTSFTMRVGTSFDPPYLSKQDLLDRIDGGPKGVDQ